MGRETVDIHGMSYSVQANEI